MLSVSILVIEFLHGYELTRLLIRRKCIYVKQAMLHIFSKRSLQGVSIWEFSMDRNFYLNPLFSFTLQINLYYPYIL